MYKSKEVFNLWDYSVGHQVLLLRCNGINHPTFTNIDIIFTGVLYLNIPTLLKGIELYEIIVKDSHMLLVEKNHPKDKCFEIICEDKKYMIIANNYSIYYNDLKFDISSLGPEGKNGVLITTSAIND